MTKEIADVLLKVAEAREKELHKIIANQVRPGEILLIELRLLAAEIWKLQEIIQEG